LQIRAQSAHATGNDLQSFRLYLQALKSLELCNIKTTAFHTRAYQLQTETLSLTDKLLEQYSNSASRLLMLRLLLPLYDQAISTAFSLYSSSGKDTLYLDQAFLLSEKCRNVMLKEAIRNAGMKAFRSVPPAILERQRQLNASIFIFRNLLDNEYETARPDTLKVRKYSDSLAYFQQQTDSLNFYFSKVYPAYYRLLNRTTFVSASAIQAQLRGGSQALLKYYCSKDGVFIFVCSPKGRYFQKIDIDSTLLINMTQLQQSMLRGHAPGFAEAASFLYIKLFFPVEAYLKECDHLRVITDAYLANLPFECLIASKASSTQGFKEFDYLIRHYCFSYAPSAAMAFEKQTIMATSAKPGMIGFAPVFSADMKTTYAGYMAEKPDSLWLSLPEQRWSLRFASEIEGLIPGQWFTDTAATASRFRAYAGDYQIIHIASHTLVDEQNPMNGRIVFAKNDQDTTATNGYVCASDLYGMELNAALAVLGSCATGQGKSSIGEGMISLAYAFNYAGCASLVYSLWSVDEKETSALMLAFYQGIKKGLPKDDALHQAKIKRLDGANEITANPYYWAGFVVSGDTSPIAMPGTGLNLLWVSMGVGLLFALVLLLYIRKRRLAK
jgi:CHAT domain-containing protein